MPIPLSRLEELLALAEQDPESLTPEDIAEATAVFGEIGVQLLAFQDALVAALNPVFDAMVASVQQAAPLIVEYQKQRLAAEASMIVFCSAPIGEHHMPCALPAGHDREPNATPHAVSPYPDLEGLNS